MPPRNPIEFVRRLANGRGQPSGNRVQLEDANAVAIGAANPLDVDLVSALTTPVYTIDTWRVKLASDEDLNDNDKTVLICPAQEELHVLWVWIELTTTATVGDRQIVVEVQDAANDVIGQWPAGAVQAASRARVYMFAAGMADLTAFRDTTYLMTPLPPGLLLQAGDQLRIYDNTNTDGNDDMIVQVKYGEREI